MRTVTMFFVTIIFTVGLIACLYFLYLYNRDTAVDRQGQGGTQQENHVDQTDQENEELPATTTDVPAAVSDSFKLRYGGTDTKVLQETDNENS